MICDCTSETGCVGLGIYNCYDAIMRTTGENGVRLAEFHLKRIAELKAALKEIATNPCLDPEGNAEIAKRALAEE